MANVIIEKAKERMTQSHQSLAREFGGIRAGRANQGPKNCLISQLFCFSSRLTKLS